MRINPKEIFNNWHYWMSEKEIMSKDVYLVINKRKYEVYGFTKNKRKISYLDKQEVINTTPEEVDYILIDNNQD